MKGACGLNLLRLTATLTPDEQSLHDRLMSQVQRLSNLPEREDIPVWNRRTTRHILSRMVVISGTVVARVGILQRN